MVENPTSRPKIKLTLRRCKERIAVSLLAPLQRWKGEIPEGWPTKKEKSEMTDGLPNHTPSALKGRNSSKYLPKAAAGVLTLFWADLFDSQH